MKPVYDTPELRSIIAKTRNPLGAPERPSGLYAGWSLPDLIDEREALIGEAWETTDRAEREGRDLTADEQSRWHQLMGRGDQPGLIQALNKLVTEESQTVEAAKTRAAAKHAARQESNYPGASRLRVFKGRPEDAEAAGAMFRLQVNRQLGRDDDQAADILASRGWGVRATATEGTGSAGGYLVPDPLSAAFIEYRDTVGVCSRLSDVRAMSSDTLSVPKLTSGPTVYYPGEATAITTSDQTWGQLALSAVKRGVLSLASSEVFNDALINVGEQLASRQAYEMAKQMDAEWINGDGTATYGGEMGILNAIGSAGVNDADTGEDTWAELDVQDFTDTMALLPSKFNFDTSWVCSMAFFNTVMLRLAAEAGGNTITNLMDGTGAMRPTFLGSPVYFTDQMPTASAASTISCLFGNFKQACILGERMQVELAVSTDRYFEQDLIAFRALSRYDILWHEVGDSSNPGAVVALKTAA